MLEEGRAGVNGEGVFGGEGGGCVWRGWIKNDPMRFGDVVP